MLDLKKILNLTTKAKVIVLEKTHYGWDLFKSLLWIFFVFYEHASHIKTNRYLHTHYGFYGFLSVV